jgi:cell division protease FtsH
MAAIGALLVGEAVAVWRAHEEGPSPAQVPFSLLAQRLEARPPALAPTPLRISLSSGLAAEFRGKWSDGAPFVTTGVASAQFLDELRAAHVGYELVAPPGAPSWRGVLRTLLPSVVFLALFFLFLRWLRGGAGQATDLRRSTAKRWSETQRKTTFADVAGIEEARAEVEEIVAFVTDPARLTRLGGRTPKGVLMMGPPGTGKTLLARAIAGEAGVPFFSISGSDFVEMFAGVGASRVRSLFQQGKSNAPCIIFIDEIDAVGRRRGLGFGGGSDEREQTLNQLLVEMDGFDSSEGVTVLAATNRPDVLDPALLRPGRFDRRLVIPAPDAGGRLGILEVHTRKTPLGADVDLRVIARGTTGFVGAELSNLVNEAALLAARQDKDWLEMEDLEQARDKVLMGPARRSMTIGAAEKRAMAFRQAGHALVGKLTERGDAIHKVTIIPHGDALGITQQLPGEDRLSLSEQEAQDQIAFRLGGRAAEELIFGRLSTATAGDLEAATALARQMVCAWGMSSRIGPLSLATAEEGSHRREHAEETAREIDVEVRHLLETNQERARTIVRENLDPLRRIAQALLELETIDGAEVDLLIAGGRITRAPVPRRRRGEGEAPAVAALPGLVPAVLPSPAKA